MRPRPGPAVVIARPVLRAAVVGMAVTLALGGLTAARGDTAVRRADCTATPEGANPDWGAPIWCEDFESQLDRENWFVYDSAGHAGKGRRSPGQAFIGDGALYLYGTAKGTTAGLATRYVQSHGRWEARIRLYAGAGSYHPVALLWPQQGGGGVDSATGEEIAFLEVIDDPERQRPNLFMKTPEGGKEGVSGELDMTAYHTYAVENTPEGVVGYIDGQEWFRSANSTQSPMAACLQLDWFPDGKDRGDAWMEVDWLRIYPMQESQ
ncbi:hypothetical protein DP939_42630 [Spongiactinospora rosea]|uniref:GH16 domain-containing protein n=1 Tax=Spongiactinospora rosea TaxID=2248750 RepID=A0A366LJL5_9ACTN|nr:hypothetical protein DP939_42630 [Spongiactinospora rosea]